jgi:hypothetical protein
VPDTQELFGKYAICRFLGTLSIEII